MPWYLLAALAAAAALAFTSEEGQAVLAELLAGLQGRGGRVGPKTTADGLNVIRHDPESLAASAGEDLNTYALARMTSSEHGNDGPVYKAAIAWAVVNYAGGAAHVADVLLKAKGDADGLFGGQNARYRTGNGETAHAGKYASTRLDPREDDVRICRAVIAGELPDPTGGATNFFSPKAQDAAAARAVDGYTKTAADVDAGWRARGLVPVAVAGVEPRTLTFYRPDGGSRDG